VAKYSPKVPFVSGDARDPIIEVDNAAWQRIEKACEWSLPATLRSNILRATEEFLLFESFERSAQRLAAARVILEAYDIAAGRFFHALFTDPSGSSDADAYVHLLIERNFKKSRPKGEAAVFDALLDLLRAFHIACNVSLKQLSDHTTTAFESGNAWRSWVSRLTEIVDEAELPSSVRKDADKSNNQSPFTLFVWELQKCLPEECRRHTHSEAALADAISQAQSMVRKLRGPKSYRINDE
jgi:hypothetical protein